MTEAENKILTLLKRKNLTKLEVFVNQGSIIRVQGTEYHSPEKHLQELTPGFKYQEITLIHENGKARKIRRLFKEKF